MQELGLNYTQEQLDQIKRAEEQRLRQRRMEREAKERERLAELYEDCDDRFAFIAGYTDGGAPYGVMWEEVGIDPGLPHPQINGIKQIERKRDEETIVHITVHDRIQLGRTVPKQYRPPGVYTCLGSFFSQYSTNLVTHSTQRPLGSFPHANMQ